MFEGLQDAVLFWSSGFDSTLLLMMMLEAEVDFDIVQFRDGWTKEQKKSADELIIKHDLTVFSYAPMSSYFIGQGDDLALVQEIAIGGATIPLLRDVIAGTQCIADLQNEKMTASPFKWKTVLVGSRKEDIHWSFDKVIPSERWMVGDVGFYAPLFEMARQEILDLSKAYGLDIQEISDEKNTGNLAICSLCLQPNETGKTFCPKENAEIDSIKWNRDLNTANFRIRRHAA